MVDLDHLRSHPQLYEHACRVKGVDVNIRGFLKLDALYRELLKMVEEMRARKNSVSKRIPGMKGEEKEEALAEMKKLGAGLREKEKELSSVADQWKEMQLMLPSLPLKKVPIGETSAQNKTVKTWGDVSRLPESPRGHVTLGEGLSILDIPRAVKFAGARSYLLKGDGARLELAVLRFAIDHLLKKGWELFIPPVLVDREAMIGMGQFPGAIDQTYAVGVERREGGLLESNNLYLVGTSEVSLLSYHRGEVLQASDLPVKYCGLSTCFRREAGTYGKDTKGIFRIHQFQKVEQVVLCEADEKKSLELFEEMRTNAEEVLQTLDLPYRVVDVCTGDMGQGKVYMQDIETWMPSRKSYGETHSCSYLGEFQSRRLNIKYEDAKGEKRYVHTLNNTCIASPRILIPLLEIYQNRDGSVTVPEALQPYMGGQRKIEKRMSGR
jgi:seryl-tRNA synthetase